MFFLWPSLTMTIHHLNPYQVSRGPPDLGNFRRPWRSRSPGGANKMLSWHSQFGALDMDQNGCPDNCDILWWSMLEYVGLPKSVGEFRAADLDHGWDSVGRQCWTIPRSLTTCLVSFGQATFKRWTYVLYGSSFLPFFSCPCVPAVVVSKCWPTKLLRLLYMLHLPLASLLAGF